MISVSEAKMIIQESVEPMTPVDLLLQDAGGLMLASDIIAKMDIPAFPQSSVDGYAFSFNEWNRKNKLQIEGEIPAGDDRNIRIGTNTAIRIFTGAPVPAGADTVVMQEKVLAENNQLFIDDTKLVTGSNVRPAGSEIKAGETALQKESYLSAAAIGFLAGIGVREVNVIPSPRVCIIVTGNELQSTGKPLSYGKVYDSNSVMLTTALQRLHVWDVEVQHVRDDLQALTKMLDDALKSFDLVLLVGGVSVGDFDFVLKAATDSGVSSLFHKIKQRPGKPLYFGKKGKKLVFGLPGNPSSALVCFYIYVLPAIHQMKGTHHSQTPLVVPLSKSYIKDPGLTHFLKGYYNGKTASPLHAQESYRLRSFAEANCLIQIDEDVSSCEQGGDVLIYRIPL